MFDKVKPGYCKLAMNGEIAVRTAPNVYKTYDVKTGNLVNCSDFAFDMDGMFWDCGKLTELNIDNWDVSNVTDMKSMFNITKKPKWYK